MLNAPNFLLILAIQMVLKVFRDFEQNYPERLGEAYVVNGNKYLIRNKMESHNTPRLLNSTCLITAPWVLNYIWPLVKPLLTGKTMQKVRFLGSDPNKFIPELLERMPVESISPKLCALMKNPSTA